MKHALGIVALLACAATASRAATAPAVPEGLLACAKLQDVGERVRCYDQQVATMRRSARGATPAAVPPARSAPTVPRNASTHARGAPQDSSAAHFGEEFLPQSARPAPKRNEQVLESSITSVRKVGYDSFLISLANGQVWRQDGNHLTFFRAGDPVRIEKHALGSYHLSSPTLGSKNWVYVTRVQ